ncbi:MAG: hypothetical protein BZY82_04555 [SAR202 cluster bacterium Io17-Chloro-G3]|nr:MAG: hypothetical protein BZY82_04555 [SAR202 cluster bacterium Io17-Chloro-G3]
MAARWVAGMVVALTITIILTNQHWLMFILAYGFLARVLTGPKLSLMGLIATRVLVPMFGNREKIVAGPPKRFAQFIGLICSITALVVAYGFGLPGLAEGILAAVAVFAMLESFFGVCVGCIIFGYLMKLGVIPEETCRRCADIRGQ